MNSRISCSGMPSCTRCGGSPRRSPNCRFEQISCRSASNTAMPWRTWFSAVCRISRLKCSAAWESSSSFSAVLAETVRLRNSSDITRREEAAPIEEAIRRSACCSSSKSAGMPGSSARAWPAANASNACRARSGPRYCATVLWMSCTVTVVRQRRKVGAIGASALGTNKSACSRSIADG